MTIDLLKTALLAKTTKVYHYTAPVKAVAPYIVWQEDSRTDLVADNKHGEAGYNGTIDLYSKTENDLLIAGVEQALDGLPLVWKLNNVVYEEETKIIHHEWLFSTYG